MATGGWQMEPGRSSSKKGGIHADDAGVVGDRPAGSGPRGRGGRAGAVAAAGGQGARAFDIGLEQVALPSLGGRAGKVIDLVHTAQGGPHAAFVVEADHGHFHRNTFWQSWRLGGGAQQYPNLMARVGELTYENSSDKSGCASNENHA